MKIFQNKKAVVLMTFAAGMIVLTIVAKIADSYMLPEVTAGDFEQMSLQYPVNISGEITSQGIKTVYGTEDLRIGDIKVQEGDLIEIGDVLFTYDMAFLDEKISDLETEMEKQKLQIESGQSSRQMQENKKNQSIHRANRDYQDTVEENAVTQAEAYQDMEAARVKLEEHINNPPQMPTEDNTKTMVPDEEILQNETEEITGSGEETVQGTAEETTGGGEEAVQNTAEGAAGSGEEAVQSTEEEAIGSGEEALQSETEETTGAGEETGQPEDGAGQEAETDPMEEWNARMAEWEQEKEALEQDYEQKKRAYEAAVRTGNESEKNAQRQVEDAKTPLEKDNSIKLQEIDKEDLEENLNVLKQIKESGGSVCSEISGKVQQLNVGIGDIIGTGVAVFLEDFSQSFQFEGIADEQTAEHLKQGDICTIRLTDDPSVFLENQEIDRITEVKTEMAGAGEGQETAAGNKMYQVRSKIQSDQVKKSGRAQLELVTESNMYQNCVPVSALYGNSSEQYILMAKEEATTLGMQTVVVEVPVKVLEKNDTYAAVEGSFEQNSKVILRAGKSISDGERVKVVKDK
ncbi:MAG: hypothetical protein KH828_08245 [Clostridiales bacterium]|nr:hypothetical protein [Clostridiales bacterium]